MKNIYKHKYFEKNVKESHTLIFKNLEIKNYLQKTLKDQNINLYNQNINLSESSINLFLPIHETEQTLVNLKKKKSSRLKKLNELRKKITILKKKIKEYYNNKQVKNIKTNKVKVIKLYKIYLRKFQVLNKKFFKNITKFNNTSNEHLLESLSLFTNHKLNIHLKAKQNNKKVAYVSHASNNSYENLKRNKTRISSNLKRLTRDIKAKKQFSLKQKNSIIAKKQQNQLELKKIEQCLKIKQNLLKFKKFEKSAFFKEGKHVLLAAQYNSANLLADYISKQLKMIKRHNFFLSFLKESLSFVINNQKHSKIRGIKLIVKGRLNNAARSNHKTITLGKIGLITNKFNIDYSESTAFTSNGTIGVKVWICKKRTV